MKKTNEDKDLNQKIVRLTQQGKLTVLVKEILALVGEVDLPIPKEKQAKYLDTKTTHEYFIKCAHADPEDATKCYELLKAEIFNLKNE